MRHYEILIGFLLSTAIWAVVLTLQSDPSAYYQICETNQYTEHQSCTPHHLLYVAFWYIGYVINPTSIGAAATVAIAWFTLTLKRSTDKLWKSGTEQIALARDDFNATHRPWVPITGVAINFGLTWAAGNAIVGLTVYCKNIGNSPAQRVSLVAAIYPFLPNDDIPSTIAKIQEAYVIYPERPLIEHTLFPDVAGETQIHRSLVITESQISALKDGYGEPATEMVPVILGSIEYYFPFGERKPHYTPFVYHLWRTETEGVARLTFKLDGNNIEANKIILVPLINAGDPT